MRIKNYFIKYFDERYEYNNNIEIYISGCKLSEVLYQVLVAVL